jgi:hypothetical protein
MGEGIGEEPTHTTTRQNGPLKIIQYSLIKSIERNPWPLRLFVYVSYMERSQIRLRSHENRFLSILFLCKATFKMTVFEDILIPKETYGKYLT